jgi:hypothetical protein
LHKGEITLGEATGMVKLVEVFVRVIEASDLDERLKMLEDKKLLGDHKREE